MIICGIDMAILIEFGYLPEGFEGFARQPGRRTVEGEIIEVLIRTGAVHSIEEAGFKSSSRTDRGVGAFQNYFMINSVVPGDELLRRLNSMIEGAYFYGVGDVDKNFNPRHAVFREYVYYIDGSVVGRSMVRFKEALKLFTGTHSFYSFTKKDRTKNEDYFRAEHKIDKITVEVSELWGRDMVEVTFRAEFFLYGQIRKMLKAALLAAKRKIGMTELEKALEPDSGTGRFPSHPPGGLFLKRVKLPDEVEDGIKRYDIPGEGIEKMMAEAAVELRALSAFRGFTGTQ